MTGRWGLAGQNGNALRKSEKKKNFADGLPCHL
jgi:hypothetical protein